jgi:hypothetical protein
MEQYRSIDADWEQDEYIYIDDCGELKKYLFNGKKYCAVVSMNTEYFSKSQSYSVAERIVFATKDRYGTGVYQFNHNSIIFWIYNSVLGAHNKPESFVNFGDCFEINFNKNIQKLEKISGTLDCGSKIPKHFNIRYNHSGAWDFNLHSNGEFYISSRPNVKGLYGSGVLTLDQRRELPKWFLKCKKDYSYYVQVVEDAFAQIPLD